MRSCCRLGWLLQDGISSVSVHHQRTTSTLGSPFAAMQPQQASHSGLGGRSRASGDNSGVQHWQHPHRHWRLRAGGGLLGAGVLRHSHHAGGCECSALFRCWFPMGMPCWHCQSKAELFVIVQMALKLQA